MSHGLEIYNASGQERLDEESFVHRLMGMGSGLSGDIGTVVEVAWTGMTASDEWFILTTGGFSAYPGIDRFYVQNTFSFGPSTFTYVVYRR